MFALLAGAIVHNAAQTPAEVVASSKVAEFQRLEGADNQGTAVVEVAGGAGFRVSGAVATPFQLGGSTAGVVARVRILLPERGVSPDFGSACLVLYGKDRSQRLAAFIAFKVPGMAEGDCEVGFLAHKSVRVPATFGKWYTLAMETRDGVARMKAWADGTAEPGWMVEEEVEPILQDVDACGLRTYALPVLFESFSASGRPSAERPKLSIGSAKQGMIATLRNDGSVQELRLRFARGWRNVEFRRDAFRGPGFGNSVALAPESGNPAHFTGEWVSIRYRLAYKALARGIRIVATVENRGAAPFAPERLPLTLGVDSFMDSYPRWNDLFFPTFFRCEPTHLWGYMMTPSGEILGVASPDPVGSYTIEYMQAMYAHYIYTVSLDLLQKPPVPAHHPVYAAIPPGGKRSWTIDLLAIDSLEEVKPTLSVSARAPTLELYRHTLEPGQPVEMSVCSPSSVSVSITRPDRSIRECPASNAGARQYRALFHETGKEGYYTILVRDKAGKTATGSFFVRPNWSWYLKHARLEALRLTPRADLNGGADGYSCETHYGLLGFYLAAKHFPDPAIDAQGDQILDKVLNRLYREKDGMRFSGNSDRIQNGSFMLSVLVKRYEATGDTNSLEKAVEFAEFLLSRQAAAGYYGGYGMQPYTSVLYVAKAIMELMAAEKPLGKASKRWKTLYDRHYDSVRRAIDQLVAQGRDVKTEGGGTFEDGAVSCTATQIAMFALLQTDPHARSRYIEAGRAFLTAHSCLTRLLDTDARSVGATERWWEAWADERREAQMMTSPHGWSGWRLYAVYYLYLLTGEERYLRGVMDALGAGVQLLEWPSGRLRQAFVVDPHVRNYERVPDPADPHWGRREERVTSEGYIKTMGDWFGRTTEKSGVLERVEWAWTGDGIPLEIFKAMEEIALDQAFVLERADGSVVGYNCTLKVLGKTIDVTPAEYVVRRIHMNLRTPRQVRVRFPSGTVSASCRVGLKWITGASMRTGT